MSFKLAELIFILIIKKIVIRHNDKQAEIWYYSSKIILKNLSELTIIDILKGSLINADKKNH